MNNLKGLIPPQSTEVEEVVLAAMLIDERGKDEALELITDIDTFYKIEHKEIFKAIQSLSLLGDPVDILSVSAQLKKAKKLEVVGGDYYLIQLTQKVSSSAHIEFHCRIILQNYLKRKLIALGNSMIEKAYKDEVDVFDILDTAEADFTTISELINKGKSTATFSDSLTAVADRVEYLTNNEGKLTGVSTGIKKLNKHTGGWQPTDFVVIGARPGMGKTAFVVNNAYAAAAAGDAVGFISMEMSSTQLATRAVAINSDFHLRQLTTTGFEKSSYFNTLNEKITEMRDLPIYIDDRPSLTIADIKRTARKWKRKHNLKILIVDYIQLVDGVGDPRIRTGITSRGLKHIAKELNIPVIGLSQLSRAVENTPLKRPAMHHLKEAGDIEQDADFVGFIYRSEYYNIEPNDSILEIGENTEFITSKFRSGALGVTGMYFEANKTKFMDAAPAYTEPF